MLSSSSCSASCSAPDSFSSCHLPTAAATAAWQHNNTAQVKGHNKEQLCLSNRHKNTFFLTEWKSGRTCWDYSAQVLGPTLSSAPTLPECAHTSLLCLLLQRQQDAVLLVSVAVVVSVHELGQLTASLAWSLGSCRQCHFTHSFFTHSTTTSSQCGVSGSVPSPIIGAVFQIIHCNAMYLRCCSNSSLTPGRSLAAPKYLRPWLKEKLARHCVHRS